MRKRTSEEQRIRRKIVFYTNESRSNNWTIHWISSSHSIEMNLCRWPNVKNELRTWQMKNGKSQEVASKRLKQLRWSGPRWKGIDLWQIPRSCVQVDRDKEGWIEWKHSLFPKRNERPDIINDFVAIWYEDQGDDANTDAKQNDEAYVL